MGIMQHNRYVNEAIQKARISRILAYIKHAFAIWKAFNCAKQLKKHLYILWLDLANAYGSVPHSLIQAAMDFFGIPEVQHMLMCCCDIQQEC